LQRFGGKERWGFHGLAAFLDRRDAQVVAVALDVLKLSQLWGNPDCGLKTRGWPEATEALKNMCAAPAELRASIGAAV
jgi:Cobalamin-independent synthase, Catalytic domain